MTDDESLLNRALEGTSEVDTTTVDITSLDNANGNEGVLSFFAMLMLSASNDELLMAKVLEREAFEDDIETQDNEGAAAVVWPATLEFGTATCKILLALLFVRSDDNTEADVINTKVAVIKDNRRNLWYCLYV